jgi:hypothetical protein
VIEDPTERRLVVAGDVLSVYPLDGDWSRFRHEYWWQAIAAVALPRRASALLVGLGGGTQVHLLDARARPRLITVIERDPIIMRAALEWFGLGPLGPLECYTGEAAAVAQALVRTRRRFDFVMEDSAYAAPLDESRTLVQVLAEVVTARGVLVINRHRRGDGSELASMLRPSFERVWQRRVRREGENTLVFCHHPLNAAPRRGHGVAAPVSAAISSAGSAGAIDRGEGSEGAAEAPSDHSRL